MTTAAQDEYTAVAAAKLKVLAGIDVTAKAISDAASTNTSAAAGAALASLAAGMESLAKATATIQPV